MSKLKDLSGNQYSLDAVNTELVELTVKFGKYYHEKLDHISSHRNFNENGVDTEGRLLFDMLVRVSHALENQRAAEIQREQIALQRFGNYRVKFQVYNSIQYVDRQSKLEILDMLRENQTPFDVIGNQISIDRGESFVAPSDWVCFDKEGNVRIIENSEFVENFERF